MIVLDMALLGVSNPVQEFMKFEDYVSSDVISVTCSLLGVSQPADSDKTSPV